MRQLPPPTAVNAPHILGRLALEVFVELLVSIALPVVEVPLVVTIPVATTEIEILLEIVKGGCDAGVFADLWACHVMLLLNRDKLWLMCFVTDQAAIFAVFGDLDPYRSTGIAICDLEIQVIGDHLATLVV
jgi:hypothetical protein